VGFSIKCEALPKELHCFELSPTLEIEEQEEVGMAVVFGRRSNPSPVTVAGSGENA
jgi:hypothetical protein